MTDKHTKFAEQLASVRPTTRGVVTSILLDTWPSLPAILDFGINSQEHYEALYFSIRAQEISPKALDAALGDGQKLTALVREAASNPHKDIEFHTPWDVILGRDNSRTAEKVGLEDLRNDGAKARSAEKETGQEHDRGDLER